MDSGNRRKMNQTVVAGYPSLPSCSRHTTRATGGPWWLLICFPGVGIEPGCDHKDRIPVRHPEAGGVRDLGRTRLLVAPHYRVVEHVLDIPSARFAGGQQLPEVANAVDVLAVDILDLTALEPEEAPPPP